MRIFQKLILAFLVASLLPLLLAGGVLLREVDRSLRRAAVSQQETTARRTTERVLGYLDNVQSLLGVLRGSADLHNPSRRSSALESVLNNGPMFSDLALIDSEGKEVERLSRTRNAGEPIFPDPAVAVRAAKDRDVYLGTVQYSAAGYPILPFCATLESKDRLLAGRLNLLDLSARLRGQEMGEGALLRVMDKKGRLIAHSSDTDLFQADKAGILPLFGRERLLRVKTVVPRLEWTVVLEQPERVVFAMERRVRHRILGGLVLAVGIAMVFGVGIARSFVRPLSAIQKAVEDLAQGKFKTRVGASSKDEIGVVAARLREAQRVLEAQVRQSTVGLLVHRIGHDLRQPLTAIRESVAVVRRHASGADAVALRHLDVIDQEIAGGLDSIEDLLTLGRERPPRLTEVNLNAFARETVARLPPPPGITVTVTASGPDVDCRIDQDEVRRAFVNGLRNAFESGGINVVVGVSRTRDRGWVSIVDDGRGIPDETRAKIFTDFFTTKPNGTGLGLGIIQRAVDRSGGTVLLENNINKGATLTMGFPLGAKGETGA